MDNTVDSVVPGNNLLPAGWDKALMERLQPARKRANHKRAPALNDIELTFTQLQFTTTQCNEQQECRREKRAQSEDPSIEACARQRRQRYKNDKAHLTVEHDEFEMSRKGPGDRKHQRSSSKADVVDLSNDSELALLPHEEGEESADSLETESVDRVVSAKRVKPNPGQNLKGHSVTPDLSRPTKSVSSGNAGTLRSGRLLHRGEEINVSVQGNARDQKEFDESKAPAEEKWDYFNSYPTRKPSSFRDYSNPSAAAPVPVPTPSEKEDPMAPFLHGGPRPVNRLSSNTSKPNPNPLFKKLSIAKEKFDLFENNPRPNHTHPRKRQKIEGPPVSHNGSATSPIDLDDEPTEKRRQTGSTTRSTQSQTQNGHRFGVEEYSAVENMVDPRHHRQSNTSDSQISSGQAGKQFLPPASTVARLDDAADPISEDDSEVTEIRHVKRDALQTLGRSTGKSTVEVQIPAFLQAKSTTGYQGTSNTQLSRPKPKIWGNGDPETPAETSRFSKFFPSTQNHRQGNNSKGSHSAYDAAPARTPARFSSRQVENPSTEIFSRSDLNPQLDTDASVDELNSDAFNLRTANTQLVKRKTATVAAEKSKGTGRQGQSVAIEDFSDDDLANKKADIKPTIFASKKVQHVKRPDVQTYQVLQAFSECHKWLLKPSNDPWSLIHDTKAGTLTVLDEFGQPELDFPTISIANIVLAEQSSKIVIHKSRDMQARNSIHIYLQLSSPDQSLSLAEHLQSIHKTIGLNSRQSGQLDKVFQNIASKPSEQRKKRLSQESESPDVQLAEGNLVQRNAERRDRIKSTNANRAGQNLLNGSSDDVSDSTTKPRGLAKSMRTQSNSDPFEDGELSPRGSIASVLPPDKFYSGHNTRRSSLLLPHETRPSTRASERDQKPRQQRPRSPCPPPRWTTLNPEWAKDWHTSVIYPVEGKHKDKARVDKGDIEKLDEGEFLNDNLIIFYLRWLQHRLEQEHPKWAKRIFFQNTFFYERLTSPEKGKKGINYSAVERWTAKVNLLDYDYIIIPVNEHLHWYVAIICNASKLLAGAEVTDHSQSQGNNEILGDEGSNTEVNKTSSASVASPKQTSDISNDRGVDAGMRHMSLEDKKPEDSQESEWPDDHLDPAPMPRSLLRNIPSLSNNDPEGQDVVETGGPAAATLISDPSASANLKASQTKKSKRKSIPIPRKYNPKEFRIITLDSLGTPHSSACTNLKEYLVQEIKAKLNIDIPRPGQVGTTAKDIPLQTNYYDCGLFLLSYIEMFLKNPDDFISGILQNGLDVDMQWPEVSELRARIRDLLFNLQREQLAEAGRLEKGIGKEKRVSNTEGNAEPAPSTKPSSCETSKIARASPDWGNLDGPRVAEENTIRPQVDLSTKNEPSISRNSILAESLISDVSLNSNGVNRKLSPLRDDMHKPEAPAQVYDLDADNQKSSKVSCNGFNKFISNVTTKVSGLFNNEKSRTGHASKSTLSGSDIIEIKESPQKADSGKGRSSSRDPEMQDSFRTLVEDKNGTSENGSSIVECVEKPGIAKARYKRGKSSRQSPARDDHRVLASPTPNAMEPSFRTLDGHNVQDLTSPSPEDVEPLHHGQASHRVLRSPFPEGVKAYPHAAEYRERAARALSPDAVQISSPIVRDRRPTPYPANGLGSPTEEVEVEFKGFGDEVGDSMGEEEDEVDFINPETGLEDVYKGATEASASDAEMLFQSKGSQHEAVEIMSEEEVVEEADPSLLSESPVSTENVSASKKHRQGGKSASSSPARPHEDTTRKPMTSPHRGRKRKAIGESGEWQHHARLSPVMRDSSDQAVIGRYGRTHIRFNE